MVTVNQHTLGLHMPALRLHAGISVSYCTGEVQIAKWAMWASAFTVIAGRILSLIYTHLKCGFREKIGHRFLTLHHGGVVEN